MDPGTGNNSFYQPLVYYDPIRVRVFMPPRLYLNSRNIMDGNSLDEVLNLLPSGTDILADEDGKNYVELRGIQSKEQFWDWAKTPLGKHDLDNEFHRIYPLMKADRSQACIEGQLPGYWNYNGDMSFDFEDVKVRSVELGRKEGKTLRYEENADTIPDHLTPFLGAELLMRDARNKPSAVMIDVLPTMAMYSQVFCDDFSIKSNGTTLLKGKPDKASLRFLNLRRIVNQPGIVGASGCFYSVIPFDQLNSDHSGALIDLFQSHAKNPDKIGGVFIRYTLLEVMENRFPDYKQEKFLRNPARGTVAGTISPWYSDQPKTFAEGRLLIPEDPLLERRPLGSMIAKINPDDRSVSIDTLSAYPQVNLDVTDDNLSPTHFPQNYDLYQFATLKLIARLSDGAELIIGTINTEDPELNRQTLINRGGVFDFSIPNNLGISSLLNSSLELIQYSNGNEPKTLLREIPYFISSENPGLYIEESEDPGQGFRSNSYNREPCQILIYSKGQRVNHPIPLHCIEYKITASGMSVKEVDISPGQDGRYKSGDALALPISGPSNSIYYFSHEFPFAALKDLQNEITKSGAFINLRVLPSHDYGPYTNPNHPDYPQYPDYEFIYDEFFKLYDLIYPISGEISPFSEEGLIQASGIVLHLISPQRWSSNLYMPSTREMSKGKYLLLKNWLEEKVKNLE